MHDLARLIQSRKGDASYEDLARRGGAALSRQYLARLGKGDEPLRSVPGADVLQALAIALGVSLDMVAVAALRAAGVPVRDRFGERPDPLVAALDRLTDRQRAAIHYVAEAMADPHGADLRGVDVIPRSRVTEAARMVDDALTASGVSVPVAADAVPIPARRWRHIIAGKADGTPDEWLGMAIASGANPEHVFDALGVPMPVGPD